MIELHKSSNGKPVLINANLIETVTEAGDGTWIAIAHGYVDVSESYADVRNRIKLVMEVHR